MEAIVDNELIPTGTKVTRKDRPNENWTILSPTLHTKLLPQSRAYKLQNEDNGETTIAEIDNDMRFTHLVSLFSY
jgi:hypothetical protein